MSQDSTAPCASTDGVDGAAEPLPDRYEDALRELEGLVARMESGTLPLDDLLALYQRGGALLQHCRARLQAVQDQIQVLDDGVLKPWSGA